MKLLINGVLIMLFFLSQSCSKKKEERPADKTVFGTWSGKYGPAVDLTMGTTNFAWKMNSDSTIIIYDDKQIPIADPIPAVDSPYVYKGTFTIRSNGTFLTKVKKLKLLSVTDRDSVFYFQAIVSGDLKTFTNGTRGRTSTATGSGYFSITKQ